MWRGGCGGGRVGMGACERVCEWVGERERGGEVYEYSGLLTNSLNASVHQGRDIHCGIHSIYG